MCCTPSHPLYPPQAEPPHAPGVFNGPSQGIPSNMCEVLVEWECKVGEGQGQGQNLGEGQGQGQGYGQNEGLLEGLRVLEELCKSMGWYRESD